MADLENVWLRAYVDGSRSENAASSGARRPRSPPTPIRQESTRACVSFISEEAEFTPKSVQTEKERVRLVYRIKIDIENPDRELKPGMPADARILPASGEGIA